LSSDARPEQATRLTHVAEPDLELGLRELDLVAGSEHVAVGWSL
jgi:hypothetical protein